MKKKIMYYDTNNAKIYKDLYRPSASISRFIKTLWSIILVGDSPISKHNNYSSRR